MIDINAFCRRSINANVRNFKRSTLQYHTRRASQHIRRKRIDCVCNSKSQKIQHEKRCQSNSSIFVAKDEKIIDVLFVIDFVVLTTIEIDDLKKEEHFDVFMIRKFTKTTVHVEANAKMYETKERNEDERRINHSNVSRNQHCHESTMSF